MPSFKKIERLCGRKAIDLLFEKGKGKTAHPLKLMYAASAFESPYPARVMFVVPKKKIRRANKRNTIRRRMREVYRLNKELLYQAMDQKQMDLAFIYLHHEEATYDQIENSMRQLLTFLIQQNG